VLIAYVFWKLFRKTKIVSLEEIPLEDALARVDEYYPEQTPDKKRGWVKAVSWIWD
jgi:amino acid transporter